MRRYWLAQHVGHLDGPRHGQQAEAPHGEEGEREADEFTRDALERGEVDVAHGLQLAEGEARDEVRAELKRDADEALVAEKPLSGDAVIVALQPDDEAAPQH